MGFGSSFDAVMKKTVEDMNYEYAPRYFKKMVPVASFKDRCDVFWRVKLGLNWRQP